MGSRYILGIQRTCGIIAAISKLVCSDSQFGSNKVDIKLRMYKMR